MDTKRIVLLGAILVALALAACSTPAAPSDAMMKKELPTPDGMMKKHVPANPVGA